MKNPILYSSILLLILLTSCQTTFVLTKSNPCNKSAFTKTEIDELTDSLGQFMPFGDFTLKNKDTHLEIKTSAKNSPQIAALQNSINHPVVVFSKLVDAQFNKIPLLYFQEKFIYTKPADKFRNLPNILGYVENDQDMIEINEALTKEHISLSAEGLFWSMHPMYFFGRNTERNYLIATDLNTMVHIPTTPDFLADIKALVDYENFEPSIRLVLNECGWRTFDPILKDKKLRLNSVLIGDRFYAAQFVRIRPENEICIFGFKTLEEAQAMAKLLKRKTFSISFK